MYKFCHFDLVHVFIRLTPHFATKAYAAILYERSQFQSTGGQEPS
jgi:hypothetical protein